MNKALKAQLKELKEAKESLEKDIDKLLIMLEWDTPIVNIEGVEEVIEELKNKREKLNNLFSFIWNNKEDEDKLNKALSLFIDEYGDINKTIKYASEEIAGENKHYK